MALITVAALCAIVTTASLGIPHAQPQWSPPPPPVLTGTMDPAAFVARSAERSLAEQTADIAVSGAVEAGGTAVVVSGTGQEDFGAHSYAITISGSTSGGMLTESEIATSWDLYLRLTTDGHGITQQSASGHWFEFPLSSSPTQIAAPAATVCQDACMALVTPGWLLRVLEEPGAQVTAMGTPDMTGPNCTEYVVTPSRPAVRTAAEAESAELGLSASGASAVRHLLQTLTPPALTVWIDPARQLTCQLAASMQIGMAGPEGPEIAPSTVAAPMLVTFTNYGVPARIELPARADPVSF